MNGSTLGDRQTAPDDGAGEAFPCTLLQQRLWADRKKNGSRGQNVAMRWLVEGRLSHATAEAALRALVLRHEILRTSFREEGGKLVQVVAPISSFVLRDIDLSPLSREEGEARADEIARAEAVAEIDPDRAPLLRAVLLRLGPQRAVLLLTFHSLVADGWSIGLLVSEFRAAATAIDAGAAPDRSEPELPFADYALWEREYLASGALDEARAYWRRRLDGAVATQVPPDRGAPAAGDGPSEGGQGRMESILLPDALTRAVESFARQHNITLYGLAAASLGLMLHRVTGDPDIVVGSQVANREDPAAENLVGPTVNSITLRLPVEDDASLRGFVRSVADRVQEALEYQRLPFEIAAGFAPRSDGQPLHAINLVVHRSYSGIAETDREAPGGFGLVSLPSLSSGTTWDLNFYLIGRDEGWRLSCEADAGLYEPTTVHELLQAWHRCLEALATAPDGRLADLAALRVIPIRAGASNPHRYRPALYQPARLMPEKPRPAAAGEPVPFPDPERQIVRFHESGSRTPLIALNNHSVYYQLARQLGADRPFIDIQLHHPAGPAAVAPNSFEAFAAYAIRFIRFAQPHGPYVVGGHCVYGALAFECARQLRAAGEEVLLVALFDSWAPGYREDMSPRDRQRRQRRLRRLANAQRFAQFRRGEIGFREIVWKPLLRRFGLLAPDPIPEQPASQWFDDYLQDAAELHRPAPYDGDVVLFRSAETLHGRLFDELMGWGLKVTGKLTKIEVSGAHLAMFRERPAGEIATALGGILAEKESR